MKTDFSLSLNWSLSLLEDMRSWLPRFAELPLTRELNIINFDIRQASASIAAFDDLRIPTPDPPSDDNAASTSPPVAPLPLPPAPRLSRSTRSRALAKSVAADINADPE